MTQGGCTFTFSLFAKDNGFELQVTGDNSTNFFEITSLNDDFNCQTNRTLVHRAPEDQGDCAGWNATTWLLQAV